MSIKLRTVFAGLALLAFLSTPMLPALGQAKQNLKEAASRPNANRIKYPEARKSDQVDDYHGTKVADPYRWMEDLDSADVRSWVEAENRVTSAYLNEIPARSEIKERLTRLWNYEKYGTPWHEGNRYFYFKNDGLQNQSVMYWMDALNGEPRVLIDPNTLSSDGTVALSGVYVSDDGQLMIYGLSASGSDWQVLHVRDVATGQDMPDTIKWVKFSGASWTSDGKGFFYSRYDEPTEATKMAAANYFQKLYFHRLGTKQSDDLLVYERKDEKEWGFGGNVTEDGRYLVINVWKGSGNKNLLYYKDLQDKNAAVAKLVDSFDNSYSFIGNDGPVFYILTDLNAPRSRVIAIDTRKPARENWRDVIPQTGETLESVGLINNMFVASYLRDARSLVKIYKLDGGFLRNVELPGIGDASGFNGKRKDKETFYTYTSFTTPATVYRYDMETGKSTVFRQPKVDFDPNNYETKQVFYKSKDGTRVPMFITYKKGLKLDGNNPAYLYAYGGFNVSMTPYFSVSNLVWMEMGGIFAMPNLRGGNEYGEQWHQAGMREKKQNVFDDFIAAGEWLIANKYTSTPKLSIGGGSNGGLLIGAVLNQRPDLFGAALPAVGVMDMLRFQKFTIGWAWVGEYGTSDDAQDFKTLYAYSPLHNIKPGTSYPATMITTADHDDRVVPAHSFKYAATLQAAQAGTAPILIRIETKAGHGAGKPTTKIIEESADRWAFLSRALNMDLTSFTSL